MTKVAVNKDDKDRAILTDALPYETPIIFSNEGLYGYKKHIGEISHKKGVTDEWALISNLLCPCNKYTIPFEYVISNKLDGVRRLSVVHPKNQMHIADFYAKFDQQILHLCSLSPSSLRYPSSVAAHFYEKNYSNDGVKDKGPGVELERTGGVGQLRHASSYFTYKKYNFLYKFYGSREFVNLEKRFHHLISFDVAKCFSSIYTHSIAWAVKDKEFSKEHKDTYSFESEFDKLMQNANYNETNGIVIGPEVSRIFAEVILQRVERDSINKIKEKFGLVHDIDYSIRRYVDDYFVFSKEKEHAENVFSILVSDLESYKLYINASKTEYMDVPFATNLSMARSDLQEYFESEINGVYDKVKNEILVNRPYSHAMRWINKIKNLVKSSGASYYGVSSLVISALKNLVVGVTKTNVGCGVDQQKQIKKLLELVLEVIFFIYSMDTRVRTTYVVSQVIIHINRYVNDYDGSISSELRKMIFDNSVHVLTGLEKGGSSFTPERQNLLIAISELDKDYHIPEILLAKICGFRWENDGGRFVFSGSLDYFQVISLLFYIKDHSRYMNLMSSIELYLLNMLEGRTNLELYAEYVMLLLDIISCPYVSVKTKKELSKLAVVAAGGPKENKNSIHNKFLAASAGRDWFTSWSTYVDIHHLLIKKELKTPYE